MTRQVFKPGQGFTEQDWNDVQSPELTDEELAEMRPFAEVFPELAASIDSNRGCGEVPKKATKEQSRIDADLRRINKIK